MRKHKFHGKTALRLFGFIMTLAVLSSVLTVYSAAVDYPVRSFEKSQALYFENPPVFDGVINDDEWGEPTLILIDNGSVPSSFSMRVGDTGVLADPSNTPDEMCLIWLRWDEEYFYVGVEYPDAKPFHQYADGSGDFWNGDVIQFGTDFGGNFEMQGNPHTDSWGPEYKLHLFAECSNDGQDYAFSYHYTDYSELKYVIDNNGKTTTYETAIPWESYIAENPEGIKDGKVIGFAFTILFANDDTDYYGWLGWGDNICYNQLDESRVGNNQIKLVAEPAVKPMVIETEPAAETIPAAETKQISPENAASPAPAAETASPQTGDSVMAILLITAALFGIIVFRKKYAG